MSLRILCLLHWRTVYPQVIGYLSFTRCASTGNRIPFGEMLPALLSTFFALTTHAAENLQNNCLVAKESVIRYYALSSTSSESEGLIFHNGPPKFSKTYVSTPVLATRCDVQSEKLFVVTESKVYAEVDKAQFGSVWIPHLKDIRLVPTRTEHPLEMKNIQDRWPVASSDTGISYNSPATTIADFEAAKINCPKDENQIPCEQSLKNDLLKLNQWGAELSRTPPDRDNGICNIDPASFRLGINLFDTRIQTHKEIDARNTDARKYSLELTLKDGSKIVYETGGCMNGTYSNFQWSEIPEKAPTDPKEAEKWAQNKFSKAPLNTDGTKAFKNAFQPGTSCRKVWSGDEKSQFSLNCIESITSGIYNH